MNFIFDIIKRIFKTKQINKEYAARQHRFFIVLPSLLIFLFLVFGNEIAVGFDGFSLSFQGRTEKCNNIKRAFFGGDDFELRFGWPQYFYLGNNRVEHCSENSSVFAMAMSLMFSLFLD